MRLHPGGGKKLPRSKGMLTLPLFPCPLCFWCQRPQLYDMRLLPRVDGGSRFRKYQRGLA